MVMKPEPLYEALEEVASADPTPGFRVFLTPAGTPFTQVIAHELAEKPRLVLVCGRYEGFDERALELADLRLSVGDYVLTGGELPAMTVIDAVTRLIPGVLGDEESPVEESFADGLLEYPQYTRPPIYAGREVPGVLRGGNHAAIARWRRERAVELTARLRPDLLAHASLTESERELADTIRALEPEEGTVG